MTWANASEQRTQTSLLLPGAGKVFFLDSPLYRTGLPSKFVLERASSVQPRSSGRSATLSNEGKTDAVSQLIKGVDVVKWEEKTAGSNP